MFNMHFGNRKGRRRNWNSPTLGNQSSNARRSLIDPDRLCARRSAGHPFYAGGTLRDYHPQTFWRGKRISSLLEAEVHG